MENFVSKQFLSNIRNQNIYESERIFSSAQTRKVRGKNWFFHETSVFLSHNHDDKEIIEQVILLLNKLGVEVYVDWQDHAMPSNTNGSTAIRIKEKINENKKFILLATESAIKSKWCNWELGYGDARKYHEDIAILPITEKVDNVWSGSEYLQIYPIITSQYQYTFGDYYVEFQGKRILLKDWLRK